MTSNVHQLRGPRAAEPPPSNWLTETNKVVLPYLSALSSVLEHSIRASSKETFPEAQESQRAELSSSVDAVGIVFLRDSSEFEAHAA